MFLQGELKECLKKMVDLCIRTNIPIRNYRSWNSNVKETKQSKGKVEVVVDSSNDKEEGTVLINQR